MKSFFLGLYLKFIYLISKPRLECTSKLSCHSEYWSNIVKYVPAGIKHFAHTKKIGPSELQLCDRQAPWYGMLFFHEGYAFAFWSTRWLFKPASPGIFTYWGLGIWNAYVLRFNLPKFMLVALPTKDVADYEFKLAWYYDTYYWLRGSTALKLLNSDSALHVIIKQINTELPAEFRKYALRGIGRALWLLKTRQYTMIANILNDTDANSAHFICIGMGNAMTYSRIQYPQELIDNLANLEPYSKYVLEGVHISMEVISLLSEEGFTKIYELYSAEFPELIRNLERSVSKLKLDRDNFFIQSRYYQ